MEISRQGSPTGFVHNSRISIMGLAFAFDPFRIFGLGLTSRLLLRPEFPEWPLCDFREFLVTGRSRAGCGISRAKSDKVSYEKMRSTTRREVEHWLGSR
jgi:hypothetical protein